MADHYPRLSDEQAIAREAEKIFESTLSSELWNDVKIPQERDYGLDYRIEAVTEGQLRGCEFLVQLKGTRAIVDGAEYVPLSIPTATLRYWKRKILPVLLVLVDCTSRKAYFSWFDKQLDLGGEQKSKTLRILTPSNGSTELTDLKLQLSLEPWFSVFIEELADITKLAFYRRLFSQVTGLSSTLLMTCIKQLFAPAHLTATEEGRSALKEERQTAVDNFITLFIRFINELRLYDAAHASFSLPTNPVDEGMAAATRRLSEIHDTFAIQAAENSGWAVMMTNPEKALMSLPEIASIFDNIQQALKGLLLYREG